MYVSVIFDAYSYRHRLSRLAHQTCGQTLEKVSIKSAAFAFESYHSRLHRFPTDCGRCRLGPKMTWVSWRLETRHRTSPDTTGRAIRRQSHAAMGRKATESFRIALIACFCLEGWVLQQDPSTIPWSRGPGCRAQRGMSMLWPCTFHSGSWASSHAVHIFNHIQWYSTLYNYIFSFTYKYILVS